MPISDRLDQLLRQFYHTDTMSTIMPVLIVRDREGSSAEGKDIAFFFSNEEAERYKGYQAHNLTDPYVYAASPGYSNMGDWNYFYILLRMIAKKSEAAANTGEIAQDVENIKAYISSVKEKVSALETDYKELFAERVEAQKQKLAILKQFDDICASLDVMFADAATDNI